MIIELFNRDPPPETIAVDGSDSTAIFYVVCCMLLSFINPTILNVGVTQA